MYEMTTPAHTLYVFHVCVLTCVLMFVFWSCVYVASALDTHSEAEVQRAISKLHASTGMTMLIIAHRLRWAHTRPVYVVHMHRSVCVMGGVDVQVGIEQVLAGWLACASSLYALLVFSVAC